MKLSENITWTDILTLFLLFVTVLIFVISVIREKRKANDLLQAKNYYFLSLMVQLQRKKLSKSLTSFVKKLGEEGTEDFYLVPYTLIESRSIKNITVDDLLKYYSKPVRNQGGVDFKQVQKSWFYCFEYCQQWESSQENAISEQNDLDERRRVFNDEFYEKYELILNEISKFTLEDFVLPEYYNTFYQICNNHQSRIPDNKLHPSMNVIMHELYIPILEIFGKVYHLKFDTTNLLIKDSRKIYANYRGFLDEKIKYFSSIIENQRKAELGFDESLIILIHYSVKHSEGDFKKIYMMLDNTWG